MPDLVHSLRPCDLGHLRIVAGLWGVELTHTETDAAREELAAALLEPGLAAEVVESLPSEARAALAALAGGGGKIPWGTFVRRFGDLRQVGPGRRDREQVHLRPVSAAETLFYRALLGRAFFDGPGGAQEFAYVPDDLLGLISSGAAHLLTPLQDEPPGRPATPKERAFPLPLIDRLLDDGTTLLAALRSGVEPPQTPIPVNVTRKFLEAAGILAGDRLQPEAVRAFLETTRPEALSGLAEAWQGSVSFDELRLLPGLVCEGEWRNPALETRRVLLGFLAAVPRDRWWSLLAFTLAIKERRPDFQRPAGDYDSWFIKRLSDGEYLRGFECWDEVEAELIRFFVTGPLFWLGLVELAAAEKGGPATAFRVREKPFAAEEKAKLTVASNGRISLPRLVPRAVRYQISRFCEWDEAKPDEYRYRVSPFSLKRAGGQGLKVGQLLSLLAKNAVAEVPPAFVRALKRWEANGVEARVETQVVLRVSRPEVLEELRRSKAGRFLGESLGPTAAVVKPGAQVKVLAALAEMGLLAESSADSEADIINGL